MRGNYLSMGRHLVLESHVVNHKWLNLPVFSPALALRQLLKKVLDRINWISKQVRHHKSLRREAQRRSCELCDQLEQGEFPRRQAHPDDRA